MIELMMKKYILLYKILKMKAYTLFTLFAIFFLSSCESNEVVDENSFKMLNEFCVVRTRKQVFNNDKKEVLSEMNDTIDFTVPDYFLSIVFDRECNQGRRKNNEADKQKFFEATKKLWAQKVNMQKRLLDSLVSYRDTIFFKANCNTKNWTKNNYTDKDMQYGWPYMQTDVKATQQISFLQELNNNKLHDTITFEYFYAQYWKNEKKDIEERMRSKVDPSDIGPRVRCSGRVRTTSYSAKRGSNIHYTSCSAYTNSKSGRCSFH